MKKIYLFKTDNDEMLIQASSVSIAKLKFLKSWNKGIPKKDWEEPWDIVSYKLIKIIK